MPATAISYKSGNQLSPKSTLIWRMVQLIVWLIGLAIFLSLLFYPPVGLLVFWNILIPVAPALLVVAVGAWRNVCPLATTNLLPRHFNLSQQKKMSVGLQSKLQLIAILLLYAIVPLRHTIFDTNGIATALLIFIMVAAGITMGFIFDWKSGWCSSLCPVHPVEKLYGGNPIVSLPNAHCSECVNCSIPCPDSTPNFHPAIAAKNVYQQWSGLLTIGGLPGFIWGWFQVPDHTGATNRFNFIDAYTMPLIGCVVSLCLYLILKLVINKKSERLLISSFAAAGVSCYYWYRIPALFGFGKFAGDGLLINLRDVLPQWSITLMIVASTIFFFSWLLLRNPNKKSWVLRPPYAQRQQ